MLAGPCWELIKHRDTVTHSKAWTKLVENIQPMRKVALLSSLKQANTKEHRGGKIIVDMMDIM
jgi:hypothetical protein